MWGFLEVVVPGLSECGLGSIGGAEGEEFVEDWVGVVYAVIGGVEGMGTLFFGLAPVFFEVGGWGLVVVEVDEVGEDGVEGFCFIGEGDVGAVALAVAGDAVREEHDGDELWKERLYFGLLEKLGDFGGKGKRLFFGSAAEELGFAECAWDFAVLAEDVLDGVLGAVVLFSELEAAFGVGLGFTVVADDVEFSVDGEFALGAEFGSGWGFVPLFVYVTGFAFGC